MIGNDIIDLTIAARESNWKRKGYLNKIFSDDEQQMINNCQDQSLKVWVLWSMKEAAYKAYNRMTKQRFYAPKQFSCVITKSNNSIKGKVIYKDQTYYTSTIIHEDCIHTKASYRVELLQSLASSPIPDYDFPEKVTSTTLLNYRLIKNTNGQPVLLKKSGEKIIVSKSHHGRYGALIGINKANLSQE